MKKYEYEWRVLARFIAAGDRVGLSLLRKEWFGGMARDAYEVATGMGVLSYPIVASEVAARFPEDAPMILEALKDDPSIPEHAIASYIHAISHRYAIRGIKQCVEQSYFKLNAGESAMRVRSDMLLELENYFEITPVKKLTELLASMKEDISVTVKVSDKKFIAAGIEELRLGNLMAVAGPSGTFKTTFVKWLCDDILNSNPDAIVVYFSKEQPGAEIAHKVITPYSPPDVTYSDIIKYYNVENPEFVEKVDMELAGTMTYLDRLVIIDPTDFNRPEDIAHILRSIDSRGKKVVWVLDYLTLLDFGAGDRVETMENGMAKLKAIVHQTRTLGILVNQLRKDWNYDFKAGRKVVMMPERDHIIWASAVVNLSAYVLLLYRPYDVDKAKAGKNWLLIKVDKLRFADANLLITYNVGTDRQVMDAPEPSIQQIINDYIKENRL